MPPVMAIRFKKTDTGVFVVDDVAECAAGRLLLLNGNGPGPD